MGLSKEQGQDSSRLHLLSVPDLPGALGERTYLLEHQPQPAGDSWTRTPFLWVPPDDRDYSRNAFGQAALESSPKTLHPTVPPSPPTRP